MFVIRHATASDAVAIAHLWFLLSRDHEDYHDYYEVKKDGERALISHVRDLLQRSCIIYVAESDSIVCGFVSGYIVSRNPQLAVERVGKVDNIFVAESMRGNGVGTQLLEALFSYFKQQNVRYYEISCDIQNPAALRLYKKLGFVEQKILLVKTD